MFRRRPFQLLLALLAATTDSHLCLADPTSVAAPSAAIASITFKNQCAHPISIFDGDERFCDVRAGSKATPTFGCATHLPLGLAIYSHTGTSNATKARFFVDRATNNTYYELSDQFAKSESYDDYGVGLMIYPLQFRNASVGATTCKDAMCTYQSCPDAYHFSNEPPSNKTSACPNGADFVLIFCP